MLQLLLYFYFYFIFYTERPISNFLISCENRNLEQITIRYDVGHPVV